MRVALDAMGGDLAPRETILGALRALGENPDIQVVLVGREPEIRAVLDQESHDAARVRVVHAAEVIDGHESPGHALRRKRDNSIVRCMTLAIDGQADAVVSAGNTGAVVGAATLLFRLIPGIRRAGIAVALGTGTHQSVVIDVGANIYCKPVHLLHYGIMASAFAERVLGVNQPRVALLNIGSEEGKGNELVKETQQLFSSAPFNYVGHVEGNDIYNEAADVIVCEGFVGNVVLKVCEGLAEHLHSCYDQILHERSSTTEGVSVSGLVAEVRRKTDYAEVGGAALLGVNGTCLIAHGRSNARAIGNAVKLANRFAEARVVETITEGLARAGAGVDVIGGD